MAREPRREGVAVGLLEDHAHRAVDICLDDGDGMVAAEECQVFVRRIVHLAKRAAEIFHRELRIRVPLRVQIDEWAPELHGVRVVRKGLTLGIGLDGAVERAEEAGVFAAFKLAQRLGLEARALAEGCVGIIGAEGRPVVVRTEVEVFVLVCLKLAVGIDRDRRALELL